MDRVNRSTSPRALAALVLIAAVSLAVPVMAQPVVAGRFAPKDECASLPGTAAFRSALADAVRRKDADALAALADPAVKLDFDEGEGPDELRRRLTGEGGADLWAALARIMPLGCAVDQEQLVLPWLFAQDLGDVDSFGVLLVTGDRVPLLPKADAAARPVRLLSWALVEPEEGYDESAQFQPVKIAGGGPSGFVEASKLRSPLDYRLIVARGAQGWRIQVFIAGD